MKTVFLLLVSHCRSSLTLIFKLPVLTSPQMALGPHPYRLPGPPHPPWAHTHIDFRAPAPLDPPHIDFRASPPWTHTHNDFRAPHPWTRSHIDFRADPRLPLLRYTSSPGQKDTLGYKSSSRDHQTVPVFSIS